MLPDGRTATGRAYRALKSLVEKECGDSMLLHCGLEEVGSLLSLTRLHIEYISRTITLSLDTGICQNA